MASITEKLTKLETKIEKRKAVIAEETAKLNSDIAISIYINDTSAFFQIILSVTALLNAAIYSLD